MIEKLKIKLRAIVEKLKDVFRMWPMLVVVVVFSALVFVFYPAQFGLLIYAAARMSFGAYVGYWIDRTAFKSARVEDFTHGTADYWFATGRRASIIAFSMLAGGLVT